MDQSYQSNYAKTDNLSSRIELHNRFSTNRLDWHRWVIDQLPLRPGMQVVELGCGTGKLWTHANLDLDLLLTDRSPAMIEAASLELEDLAGVRFQLLDLDNIDLESDSADLIVANHCLYHATDPTQTVERIGNALRHSGTAAFATNGPRHLIEVFELLGRLERRVASSFDLVSGLEIARRVFRSVKLIGFKDSLKVTEPEPLIRYICSLPDPPSTKKLARIGDQINQQIKTHGAYRITKESGLILASQI